MLKYVYAVIPGIEDHDPALFLRNVGCDLTHHRLFIPLQESSRSLNRLSRSRALAYAKRSSNSHRVFGGGDVRVTEIGRPFYRLSFVCQPVTTRFALRSMSFLARETHIRRLIKS